MDKIAVVILNWNGCDMLRSFLPSVVRFSEVDGAVVYVADNGSTDASVAMLRREFPSVHLILLEENHGFADGYNLALKQVEAEYVVLLNSDVEVTEHWVTHKKFSLRIGGDSSTAFDNPYSLSIYGNELFICNAGSCKIRTINLKDFSVNDFRLFDEPIYRYLRVCGREIAVLESGVYIL